jgi:hypothetical protein
MSVSRSKVLDGAGMDADLAVRIRDFVMVGGF